MIDQLSHALHLIHKDVRKPFVPLKVEKKKSGKTFAPVERLANYDPSNYTLASGPATRPANSQVQIFTDENGDVALANQQEIIKRLPTNNQENLGKAGRWCDNKIKSKPRIDQPEAVKFEILVTAEDDPNPNEADGEPKTRQTSNQANAKLKVIMKEEKSPRLVIFEKLAPNQRFYCDLKKIYCGGTEYSFEEIRSIRTKLMRKKNEERSDKEKLKQEVEYLRKTISARDDLFNDVEQMKKKLEDLLKQKAKPGDAAMIGGDAGRTSGVHLRKSPNSNEQQCTGEKQRKMDPNLVDAVDAGSHELSRRQLVSKSDKLTALETSASTATSTTNWPKVIHHQTKDADIDELKSDNLGFKPTGVQQSRQLFRDRLPDDQQQFSTQFSASPQARADRKEDLTIVRDLWNGSIEEIEQTVEIESEFIKRPQAGDFSIFKDDDLDGKANRNQQPNYQDTNTFALPQGDYDFQAAAKHASTPAGHLLQVNTSLDENCTINVFQPRDNNKLLSPIVETSREYKSHSSSSSLSGFTSYHKSRTFHK